MQRGIDAIFGRAVQAACDVPCIVDYGYRPHRTWPIARLAMTKSTKTNRLLLRRGISLAEALLASVILAIVGATATLPFVAGMQHIQEASKLDQAVSLGQALMEEVMARPFDIVNSTSSSTAPAAGTLDRSQYKTIKQFAGYSESDKKARDFQGAV